MGDQVDKELARLRAIPESWIYRIVRSHRDRDGEWSRAVESGIVGCSVARAKAEQLQADYDAKNPDKTYWTKDLFMIELENSDV